MKWLETHILEGLNQIGQFSKVFIISFSTIVIIIIDVAKLMNEKIFLSKINNSFIDQILKKNFIKTSFKKRNCQTI